MADVTVKTYTVDEARAEIVRLVNESGMSLKHLKHYGAAWALDSRLRGILQDIRGLEWLIEESGSG